MAMVARVLGTVRIDSRLTEFGNASAGLQSAPSPAHAGGGVIARGIFFPLFFFSFYCPFALN
jgi:hypothetical protein